MKPKTRKIVLSIIAGLLALMLLLPFVLEGVFIVAGAASSVSELNEKLDELDAEKKKIKKQLNEIQAEKRDADLWYGVGRLPAVFAVLIDHLVDGSQRICCC